MKQLLKGLREGDGIRTLNRKLEEMPADLNDYFMRLIESIAPQDRKEASELLQLALYQEDEFVSLHSNRVLSIFHLLRKGARLLRSTPYTIFRSLILWIEVAWHFALNLQYGN